MFLRKLVIELNLLSEAERHLELHLLISKV